MRDLERRCALQRLARLVKPIRCQEARAADVRQRVSARAEGGTEAGGALVDQRQRLVAAAGLVQPSARSRSTAAR